MKKKRMNRTKHSKVSKKDFFKDNKFLVLGVALFLVFAFLLSVVNNASLSGSAITGAQTKTLKPGSGGGLISSLFSGWVGGNLDTSLAKILLWVTLLMFIASVLNFAKFPTANGFLQFLLSLVVSFLAVAYITPDEVLTVLTSYTALGLTLGILLPFIIIFFTSAMLLSNEKLKDMSLGKVVLQVVIWAMWSSFLVYKLIKLWTEKPGEILKGGGIVLIVTAGVSILILIFNPLFRKWIWNIGNQLRKVREEAISASKVAERESRQKEYGSELRS